MRKLQSIFMVGLVLAGVALAFWWLSPPRSNAASVSPEKINSPGKVGELGTSLHLDDPRSILDNLNNKKVLAQELLLARPNPSITPTPEGIRLPEALSKISIERENKGLILEYKFKDASEQTKAAQAANPYATPQRR